VQHAGVGEAEAVGDRGDGRASKPAGAEDLECNLDDVLDCDAGRSAGLSARWLLAG
jgi:hypothetical protein